MLEQYQWKTCEMVVLTVLGSLFMSEWITFMICVVKILLVCCANYVKISAKLLFLMLRDIDLLDVEESVIT